MQVLAASLAVDSLGRCLGGPQVRAGALPGRRRQRERFRESLRKEKDGTKIFQINSSRTKPLSEKDKWVLETRSLGDLRRATLPQMRRLGVLNVP